MCYDNEKSLYHIFLSLTIEYFLKEVIRFIILD
jgi:hypothetical protein